MANIQSERSSKNFSRNSINSLSRLSKSWCNVSFHREHVRCTPAFRNSIYTSAKILRQLEGTFHSRNSRWKVTLVNHVSQREEKEKKFKEDRRKKNIKEREREKKKNGEKKKWVGEKRGRENVGKEKQGGKERLKKELEVYLIARTYDLTELLNSVATLVRKKGKEKERERKKKLLEQPREIE